jgi:hypothetical protein
MQQLFLPTIFLKKFCMKISTLLLKILSKFCQKYFKKIFAKIGVNPSWNWIFALLKRVN